MRLYLQRHCHAEPGDRMDATRKLTDAGRSQITTMGNFLAHEIGRVDVVVSSPFVRAIDTARGMADILGCEIIEQSPALEPDGKASLAWSDISTLVHALCPEPHKAHVLVVSHHPLINELAALLCDSHSDDEHFDHGAIMHIHGSGPGGALEYFVPPKLVGREESEVIEAATRVLEELVEATKPEGGLKHPRHADHLVPIRAEATAVLRRFFRRQKALLLKQIKPKLREAEGDNKAAAVIPDALPLAVSGNASYDYGKALSAAIEAGYASMADELPDGVPELSEDIVQSYLQDHSLTKLTGNFDTTTVERLRNALADAYEHGADYDGLVDAVQAEYAGFNDVRAGMIAQTEMNAAYNAGRKQLGLDMGFNEKAWDPDGMACEEICVPNVLDGWIAMDDVFDSGDDAPPGHPNCDCSLSIRFSPKSEE